MVAGLHIFLSHNQLEARKFCVPLTIFGHFCSPAPFHLWTISSQGPETLSKVLSIFLVYDPTLHILCCILDIGFNMSSIGSPSSQVYHSPDTSLVEDQQSSLYTRPRTASTGGGRAWSEEEVSLLMRIPELELIRI